MLSEIFHRTLRVNPKDLRNRGAVGQLSPLHARWAGDTRVREERTRGEQRPHSHEESLRVGSCDTLTPSTYSTCPFSVFCISRVLVEIPVILYPESFRKIGFHLRALAYDVDLCDSRVAT